MRYCPSCGGGTQEGATCCPTCGAALAALPDDYTRGEARAATGLELAGLRAELDAALTPEYELQTLLGQGGMGAVFLAWEPALKRQVAVKVMSAERAADPEARARFIREARAAAAISHPNVVRVFTVGETAERRLPYMVMQYVAGTTLHGWAEAREKISEREARRILGEVAAALDAAHQRGLVHRDVKPANILIESDSGRAFVADFGITAALAADERDESLDRPDAFLGTPAYMSPEQAGGEPVVPKSDVYSLGVVAYELLTGQRPFAPLTPLGWVAAHVQETPSSVSERRASISPDVARLIDRCLAKRPEERPTAGEVARGMLPTLESEIEWPPPGLGVLHRRARLLRWLALVSGVAGLLVLFALALPPQLVRLQGDWWARFELARDVAGSALGVRAEAPEEDEAVPALFHAWRVVLLEGCAGVAVGLLTLAALIGALLARWLPRRRAGWGWSTLLDVTADPDGRNGLLLAGLREFASLEAPRRRRILRARRWLAGASVAAGLWTAAALAVWALLVTTGFGSLPGAGPLAGIALLLVVLVPAGAMAAVALFARHRESRLMRPLARRRAYTGTVAAAAAVSSEQEVAAWYASLPQVPAPSRPARRWPALAIPAAWLTSTATLLVGTVCLAIVVWAVLVAARMTVQWGPQTAELATTLERISAQDPVEAARRVWQSYMPAREPLDRVTAMQSARALMGLDAEPEALPLYPAHTASLLGSGALGLTSDRLAAEVALAPDTLAMLEELADHPRTVLFRRLARAAQVDLFGAALDRSPAEYPTLGALPQPAYPRLREAAIANAWAAVLAVAEGEPDSAAVRLGENAAFSEHLLLNTPLWFANRFGALMLRDYALLPLAALEELRGNTERAQEVREVADAIRDHVESNVWSTRMAGFAANPEESQRYVAALTDQRLLPGIRGDALDGGWRGFCANPREIVRGPSPARSELIRAASAEMDDVPYARELAELTERTWTRTAVPAGSAARMLGVTGRGPFGILKRLRVCRAM